VIWLFAGLACLAAGVAGLRWLRVAQREHYLPGVTRFAWRWWAVDWPNRLLLGAAAVSAVVALAFDFVAVGPVVAAVIGPWGLPLRGRTAPLVWTERLRRLAVVAGGLTVGAAAAAAGTGMMAVVAAVPLLVPLLVDAALWGTAGLERRRGDRWVERASSALARFDPKVIAITGSYGKTSTKNIVAHVLSRQMSVLASPASFNNRMGLARAINEHLTAGTDVFLAEMGTYGAGEIRELCSWIRPDVAVITALGPVHLERMGSVEGIAAAKREILERAPVAVVSVDHPLLEAIAAEEAGSRRVITVSGDGSPADVSVSLDGAVSIEGTPVGRFDVAQAHPVNVACAVGVVLALGGDVTSAVADLVDLPAVPHRRSVGRSQSGFDIVDDTFNSNPAGAEAALDSLMSLGSPSGRKVVVTPGMVELGTAQADENKRFARLCAERGVSDLVVVNRTNRSALVAGAREGGLPSVILLETRDDAVRWVRETLVEGDAVLYENDLPDHYP
jgi:UDP-N-acetylmuramoyl-tripeptide--D-alanyl-D-alanine ligase